MISEGGKQILTSVCQSVFNGQLHQSYINGLFKNIYSFIEQICIDSIDVTCIKEGAENKTVNEEHIIPDFLELC